jgi:hypothetical protein
MCSASAPVFSTRCGVPGGIAMLSPAAIAKRFRTQRHAAGAARYVVDLLAGFVAVQQRRGAGADDRFGEALVAHGMRAGCSSSRISEPSLVT